MPKIARPEIGTVAWFKERKRSLLADIRALEDFSTANALVSRLVEHADIDGEDDVTEQQRGALYMSAVVTYARQFLLSSTGHSERRVYPTRHLKSDARFDAKIHEHLVDVRNKLIAHDDGEELPPELLVLHVKIEGADQERQPLLATIRSYSLSSAKGVKFLKSVQEHLEACVGGARKRMHEDLVEYLVQSSEQPEAHGNSESGKIRTKHSFKTQAGKPNEVQELFKLDALNEEIISVPKGNLHNKAYSYRMLTYSVGLPTASFKVGAEDVTVFTRSATFDSRSLLRTSRMPRFVRRIIDWGKRPLIS